MTTTLEPVSLEVLLESKDHVAATVIHYDRRGFGFAQIPGCDRTIFFHDVRQRSYYCGLDARLYDDGAPIQEAKKGDEIIIYGIEMIAKGPRATFWSFAFSKTEAEEVQRLIPTYRLQRRVGREAVSRLDPKPILKTVWEGKDLISLCKYCNDYTVRIERDEFNYFYFETLNQDGIYELCGDPRPR